MGIILLEQPWHTIRAMECGIGTQSEQTAGLPWARFALCPAGQHLRSSVTAQAFPSNEIAGLTGESKVLYELPMPAVAGDAAQSEGIEINGDNSVIESISIHYAARYAVGDIDGECPVSEYELFFDRLLNETLYFVREVLKNDRPRAPTVYWNDALALLRANSDNDPARHALVADLARTLISPLENVTSHPKRVLKRIRSKQRVQLVQEVDTHCLADLARRPGSTMPEKAGPKQQILAVTRQETVDVLENRVVRHCCELIHRAASRYTTAHAHIKHSERKELVCKLDRASMRLPKKSQFRTVGRLQSPCRQPNYVLLQNPYYAPIWQAYTKLIRNEELRDTLWRWPRRMWVDRVGVYLAESALEWTRRSPCSVCVNMTDRVLQASPRQNHGNWLLTDIMPGPFVAGTEPGKEGTLYVTNATEAIAVDSHLWECTRLGADYIIFWIRGKTIRAIPVYSMWPSPIDDPRWDTIARARIANDVLACTAHFNQSATHAEVVGALLVYTKWGDRRDRAEWDATTCVDCTCWHACLGSDVNSWPLDDPRRYGPFRTVVGV